MKSAKRVVFYGLLAAGVASAVLAGSASALPAECFQCRPCGCSSDGGQLMCCGLGAC
jgi:hypothetical protein